MFNICSILVFALFVQFLEKNCMSLNWQFFTFSTFLLTTILPFCVLFNNTILDRIVSIYFHLYLYNAPQFFFTFPELCLQLNETWTPNARDSREYIWLYESSDGNMNQTSISCCISLTFCVNSPQRGISTAIYHKRTMCPCHPRRNGKMHKSKYQPFKTPTETFCNRFETLLEFAPIYREIKITFVLNWSFFLLSFMNILQTFDCRYHILDFFILSFK